MQLPQTGEPWPALRDALVAAKARDHSWRRGRMAVFFYYLDEALEQVGLTVSRAALVSTLPHGDKRRLELAVLLAADPQLLLLDEPTAGMASEQVPMLLDIIRQVRERSGKTIMLVETEGREARTAPKTPA